MEVLSGMQVLELQLKIYVSAAYKIVVRKLDGLIPFHYTFEQIDNFSLERIISTFSRLNDNQVLISKLNSLKFKRNLVAHKLLSYRHQEIRDLLDIDLEEQHLDLHKVADDLNQCLLLLMTEVEGIMLKHHQAAP